MKNLNIFKTLNIIAWIFLAYTVYSVASNIISNKKEINNTPSFNIKKGSDQKNKNQDLNDSKPISHYKQIKERNLFNTRKDTVSTQKANTPPPPPPIDKKEVQKIKKDYKLLGTIITSKTKKAIMLNKRKDETYQIGDKLSGNKATVVDIKRGEVVVDINGLNHSFFTESNMAFNKMVTRRNQFTGAPDLEKQVERGKFTRLFNSLPDILNNLDIVPYIKNNQTEGIVVVHLNNEILKELDIKRGDIIKMVNGTKIGGLLDIQRFYYANEKKKIDTIVISLLRQGSPYTIKYQIRGE